VLHFRKVFELAQKPQHFLVTTWAEQPEPTRSDSHAWSAHPNYDFLTVVAGIRPATPDFTTVLVAPHLGSLKHVSAVVPHPKGIIEVEYTVEPSGESSH
jgi:alpha-L-rhamnosidase